MTAGQAPAFTTKPGKWLRDRGIKGDATIRLARDGLEIAGASGGLLRISTAQIHRMRTGWRSIKYGPFFLTSIWLQGEEKPLPLEERGLGFHAYAAVVRGLAEQVARTDGVKRLWRGSSAAAALEVLTPMAVLFLASIAIAIFALENEPWWGRLVPVSAALAFVILGVCIAVVRWPRPVRDLAEFNGRVAPLPKVRKP